MSDSNLTKRALARALKELMKEAPLEKINIGQICDKCEMNRKSFYYHFKDKYDLVNWIFDMEFSTLSLKQTNNNRWEPWEEILNYFYENRAFYRNALQVNGQNSLSEHFRDYAYPIMRQRLELLLGEQEVPDFYINFFTDGLICSVERWLLEKDSIPPERFLEMVKVVTQHLAVSIIHEMKAEDQQEQA